ncbi:MAG TPA: DUF1206 domain-containing protein [Phenylobacterium sp.]|jgi:hypothetical protein
MDGQESVTVRAFQAEAMLARWRRRFATAPWAAAAELAARGGYMARGVVYLSVGLIALLALLGLAPRTHGALGALAAWARWPPGVVLLWLIGIGLCGFAGWRALQALFDAEGVGTAPKALACRAGQALSGVIYGSLAVSVFGLIDTLHDLRRPAELEHTRDQVAAVMAWPLGPKLVMGLGLFVIGCGIGNAVRAFVEDFGSAFRCGPEARAIARRLARLGYFGRGLAMLPVGFSMLAAGWHERAAEARDVGAALWALHAQGLGDLILALVAAGLAAFGAFGFVEAWRRPIRPEAALRS